MIKEPLRFLEFLENKIQSFSLNYLNLALAITKICNCKQYYE